MTVCLLHPFCFFPPFMGVYFCSNTVCPGSSYPFYIVTYYIKWVTTSWTHSTILQFLYVKFEEQPRTEQFWDIMQLL